MVKTLFTTAIELSAQVSILTHTNKGLLKAIDLQKKKNKRGVRLNLCGQENKDIIDCYSPATCVRMRGYAELKEAEKEAEEKRKYDNRVKRAANALKKAQEKEEKEARAATRQLVADLKKANPSSKKASKAQPKAVAPRAKNATPIMPKARKAPIKARIAPKSPAKRVVEALIQEVAIPEVLATTRSSRTVRLPQRFKQ